jgi:pimeloyl-ACP methyl ester carboxylesterase
MASMPSFSPLSVARGGAGARMLLLLHGLGANSGVWHRMLPIVTARWPGRWIAPDLRGHGRSPHLRPYAFGTHAADLAALLAGEEEVFVLGHSMGGAIGMALANGWFGVVPRRVAAFGVKLAWSTDEIAKAREMARTPARWFETREEALERYLRVSGLKGLVDPEAASVQLGIYAEGGHARLAADMAITEVLGPSLAEVVAAMKAPLRLAAGARDPMVTLAEMQALDPLASLIADSGHNPHVEAAELLWAWAEEAFA